MSLELAITRLAEAMEANTAALLGGKIVTTAAADVKKPAAEKAKTATASTPPTAPGAAAPAEKAKPSEPIPYKAVQDVLYELCSKKGVEQGQKFVAALGYKKMTDAKSEHFGPVIAAFRAAIDTDLSIIEIASTCNEARVAL